MGYANFEVRPSKIIGAWYGLFSKRKFAAGELLFCSYIRNNFINTEVWESAYEPQPLIFYPNHSESNNSKNIFIPQHNAVFFQSVKGIAIGDEITSNYAHTIKLVNKLGYKYSDNILWFKK